MVHDEDQDSTDLMKCTSSLFDLESQSDEVSTIPPRPMASSNWTPGTTRHHHPRRALRQARPNRPHPLIPAQTQKATHIRFRHHRGECCVGSGLRETFCPQSFVDLVTYDLRKGEHEIHVNHKALGKTCGLLPVGVSSTTLTTRGLRWNLSAFTRPPLPLLWF